MKKVNYNLFKEPVREAIINGIFGILIILLISCAVMYHISLSKSKPNVYEYIEYRLLNATNIVEIVYVENMNEVEKFYLTTNMYNKGYNIKSSRNGYFRKNNINTLVFVKDGY